MRAGSLLPARILVKRRWTMSLDGGKGDYDCATAPLETGFRNFALDAADFERMSKTNAE